MQPGEYIGAVSVTRGSQADRHRYPFHLRPKNRQALQYIRMASDVVHDLDLDQALDKIDFAEIRSNQEQMAAIRAYLACYYLCSSLSATWRMSYTLPYSQWTASCCDLLEHNSYGLASILDQTLSWLVRLGHLVDETVSLNSLEKETDRRPVGQQGGHRGGQTQVRQAPGSAAEQTTAPDSIGSRQEPEQMLDV